jgi:hypothetical protein
MKHILKTKRAMVLTAVAVLAIAGAAFAYWTTTGGGDGTASVGTVNAISVTQTSHPANLYPGGDAQALDGYITNDNDSKVKVASVTAKVTGTDKDGCSADNFVIGGSAPIDAEITKGADKSFTGLTLAMKNTGDNQDACKNATVSIKYTAEPAA